MDNSVNNYRLYKSIFGNIYLSKTIFRYIQGTGCRYKEIDFTYFINNGKQINFELLKDKLNIGIPFKDVITTEYFNQFLRKFQKHKLYSTLECDQLLTRFYQMNIDNIPTGIISTGGYYDIIKTLINTKCLVLLKLYLGEMVKDEKRRKQIKLENKIKYYESALTGGDILIVKYVHSVFKLNINKLKETLLWSMVSINRDEMVDCLLNEMGYLIPTGFSSVFDINYYHNLRKLRYDQVKRILESGLPDHYITSNVHSFIKITNYIKSIPITIPTKYTGYSPFNKVLDFIQSSIYISINCTQQYYQNQISNYNDYLLKIQLLVKYNDSNCQNDEIKNEIINIQNGNGNLLKYIGSIFFKQSSITNVNFNQFNLEREIRRIYIFQYLCDNKERITMEDLSKFIIQFISSFKEYHLFENLKQIIHFKNNQPESKFVLQIFIIAFENADSTLIHSMYNDEYFKSGLEHYNKFPHNHYSIPLFYCNLIDISKQIEFLNTFTIITPLIQPLRFEYILEHIFNRNNLSIDNLNSITLVIESFYNVYRNQYPNFKYDIKCLNFNINVKNYFKNINKQHILFR